ncbi:solute carrier family 35 member E1 homolog isoform X2 [Tubulanus polymorphus]|uniref:solute carrier family 35 member E1 homolog isoform X2 n=1 Tax=Tubulanus polymorphus TaxID=672921 RepID=UPI003DA2276A
MVHSKQHVITDTGLNMPDPEAVRLCTRVVFLCLVWYFLSAANNVVGKTVLNDFPYPTTVTMVQLISISCYLTPVLKLRGISTSSRRLTWNYYCTMIIPLAFGKFFSSVTSHISIWKVPVSYAHTVKATMPFFVVILSRLILKEKQTSQVYFSLVPIISGVVIATMTELSFNIIGLLSALGATLGFSLQNIFSKKCLHETSLHHLQLLIILAKLSAVMFLPFWIFIDVQNIMNDSTYVPNLSWSWTVFLLLLDGFLNFAQNIVAFTVLALVTSLSYAVANATKRIVVISASLLLLQNPVTTVNLLGMLLAILGVLIYNKAKYDQNREKRRKEILPLVRSEIDLTKLSPPHSHHLHRSNSVYFTEHNVTIAPPSEEKSTAVNPLLNGSMHHGLNHPTFYFGHEHRS